MSHTPGPWRVGEMDRRCVTDENGDVIAEIHNWRDTDDAYLIAAAPDLLAACKAVLNRGEGNLSREECDFILREAIAKAEGKP